MKADALGDRHVEVGAGARLELELVHLAGGSTDGDGGAIRNEGAGARHEPCRLHRHLHRAQRQLGGRIGRRHRERGRGDAWRCRTSRLAPSSTRVDIDRQQRRCRRRRHLERLGHRGAERTRGRRQPRRVPGQQQRRRRRRGRAQHLGQRHAGLPGLHALRIGDPGRRRVQRQRLAHVRRRWDRGRLRHRRRWWAPQRQVGQGHGRAGACGTRGSIAGATAGGRGGGMYNLGTVSVPVDATLSIDGADKGRDASSGGGIAQAGGSIDVAGSLTLGLARRREGRRRHRDHRRHLHDVGRRCGRDHEDDQRLVGWWHRRHRRIARRRRCGSTRAARRAAAGSPWRVPGRRRCGRAR